MTHTGGLIGAAETARLLGVDRSTVSRWAKSGRLAPVEKLPGRNGTLVFNRTDIEALLEVAR